MEKEKHEKLPVIYTCFPEGKHKVLTMSYDDGCVEDRKLVSLFNHYGIKGTFHLNSGLIDEKKVPLEEYKTLYAGHEVACHTYTHPTIGRCPMEQVAQQILQDRRILEETMGYPVRGLSYPNGSYSEEIKKLLPSLGIQYARTVKEIDDFSMPEDYMEWKATCHHNHHLLEYGQQFVDLHKKQYLYMMYVWGHSYEFTQKDNWKVMEDFCKLAGGRDDIWYATNIEIVDYLEASKRLQFSAKGDMVYNPSACAIWLEVDRQFIEAKGGTLTKL